MEPTNLEAPKLSGGIRQLLDSISLRAYRVQAWNGVLGILLYLILSWQLRALLDRCLNLSWTLRAVCFALDVVVVCWILWKWVIRTRIQKLSRRQSALLMERRLPELQLRSSLISAIELTETKSLPLVVGDDSATPTDVESWLLVKALCSEVEDKLAGEDWTKRLFDGKRLRRLSWITLVVMMFAVAMWVIHRPLSEVLLQRIWLSFVPLPIETIVVSVTENLMAMAGEEVTVKSRAEGMIPNSGNLRLMHQDGGVELVQVKVDPEDHGLFIGTIRNVRGSFTYRFELNDGIGEKHLVKVAVPPVLQELYFIQKYPDYTGMGEVRMPATGLKILQGSVLKLHGVASSTTSITKATVKMHDKNGQCLKEYRMHVINGDLTEVKLDLEAFSEETAGISIHLTDQNGVESVNEPEYRLTLIKDTEPLVEMLQPEDDRLTLLPYDHLPLLFRVSDDFGLTEVAVKYRLFRTGLTDVNEATERGEVKIDFSKAASAKGMTHQMDWDLAKITPPLTPGCRIHFWVEAKDNNTRTGPAIGRSEERYIDVVTARQKHLELMELLGQRARALERLLEMQREVNEKTDQSIR